MMKVKVFNSQTSTEILEVDLSLINRVGKECTIGRSPNSGLILDSPDVSRLHGKFFLQDGDYYFCDLGSRNGSLVNGKVALTNQPYILQARDIIRLGEFVLTIAEIHQLPDEELPQTVFAGVDATVISGWRYTDIETPEIAEAVVPESGVPQPVAQTHDLESEASEPTHIQSDVTHIQTSDAEVFAATSIQGAEAVGKAADITDTPAPKPLEAASGSSQVFEEIGSNDTYIQRPDLTESHNLIEQELKATPVQPPHVVPPVSQAIEAIEATEAQKESGSTHIQAVEDGGEVLVDADGGVPEVITPTPAISTSDATEIADATNIPTLAAESEVPKIVTPISADVATGISETTHIQVVETGGEAPEVATSAKATPEATEISEETYIPTPAAKSEVPETTPEATEIFEETYIPPAAKSEVPDIVTSTPVAPEVTSTPVTSEVADVMAQTPTAVSEMSETFSEKYIALMAHDSKKAELVQLVAQNREFFSKCQTVATPSVSDVLSQQAGIAINQRTPTVPVGGFQAIASLVGTGDILAVIFLRDFLTTQAGQANEEALIRLCNINEVLLATNVATAEAIIYYLKEPAKRT